MQQLPEKRNPTHHLESRNYILNVRDISRNNDNADDKLNENLVMEMKRCSGFQRMTAALSETDQSIKCRRTGQEVVRSIIWHGARKKCYN
jgi:hypothetical protein